MTDAPVSVSLDGYLVEPDAKPVQVELGGELHLRVVPVVLGSGTPLFAGDAPRLDARLVELRDEADGVHVAYRIDT